MAQIRQSAPFLILAFATAFVREMLSPIGQL